MKDGEIGKKICALNDKIKRRTGCAYPFEKLTGLQGSILGFLGEREGEIYAKDIASVFGLNRSTVSEYLCSMERQGFVEIGEAESDRRLKRIRLTPRGRALSRHIRKQFKNIDREMTRDLSEEDKQVLLNMLETISSNLDALGG